MFEIGLWKRLWNDTDGVILPYVTILLVVIIGFAVLALDGARLVSLQTQLQNGADALALAGAAELDGAPTAIARAENAINKTFASFPEPTLFGTGANKNVTISSRCYLAALPNKDSAPIPSSSCLDPTKLDSSLNARFVEVKTNPVAMPTILPASFFGGLNVATSGATAVAGMTQSVCKFTPMYVCNPWESIGNTNYDAATAAIYANQDPDPNALVHRRMYALRADPGTTGSTGMPGNYGFLVSPLTNGFSAIRDAFARTSAPACFAQPVTTQTGFSGYSIAHGVNVRFDLYDGSMSSKTKDANYAPAPDVRKGYIYTSSCNASPATDPTQAMPLPPDTTFPASPGVPYGAGDWDFNTYWKIEHPGVNPPTVDGHTWGNTTYLPSRYSVYLYEIKQGANSGGLNDKSGPSAPGSYEDGNPHCNTPPDASPERRILYTAIINCQALISDGVLGGGKSTNIPVAAYAKFFLINPVNTSTATIDAEMVGITEPGDGVSYDNVQLYR